MDMDTDTDTMSVCHSRNNTSTAKFMYNIASQALSNTMDGIIDEQSIRSQHRKVEGARVPKTTPENKPKNRRERLRRPKILNLTVPNYKQDKDATFLYLIQTIRYERFANDTQALNQHFIKRSLMNAMWYKTVRKHYFSWDGESFKQWTRKQTLDRGTTQADGYEGFDPKTFWEMREVLFGMVGMSVTRELGHGKTQAKGLEMARRRKREFRRAAGGENVAVADCVAVAGHAAVAGPCCRRQDGAIDSGMDSMEL